MMVLQRNCPSCRVVHKGICSRCRNAFIRARSSRLLEGSPVHSVYTYESSIKHAVWSTKNSGRIDILRDLVQDVSEVIAKFYSPQIFDAVTWVPSSRVRRRQRGYDQGRIMAKFLGRLLSIRSKRLLLRAPHRDRSQVGQSRLQRRVGPQITAPNVVPNRILLVDDVVTSGASLAASIRCLRSAGALEVVGVTIASVEN